MKRFLIGLSVTVNLLVLAGAIWVATGAPLRAAVRAFVQPAHDRWVSQFAVLPVQPGDVVFLGDSITEGGAWEELFPDVPVRNRGIGGDRTPGALERLDQVTKGQPAKVFLKIGTNDLFVGTPEEEIAANIGTILERIASESPETRAYVQSVLPRQAEWREAVESLNRRLEAVAGEHGATWVDLYPLFLDPDDGSIRDDLANDELHLLGKGYLVWRDHIDELVTKRGELRSGARVKNSVPLGELNS